MGATCGSPLPATNPFRASTMTEMLSGAAELLKTCLLVVGALLPIVNPLGNAPLFMSLTGAIELASRAAVAQKVAVYGFVLLVMALLIGTYILSFFGISLPVVQVAGGLVVVSLGWTILHHGVDVTDRDAGGGNTDSTTLSERAFYPLTLPLTVGPGSISVAIALGANRGNAAHNDWVTVTGEVIGAAVVCSAVYLSYRFAEPIARALGKAAMNVIVRLSSFILLCIGVQITWTGVRALLKSV